MSLQWLFASVLFAGCCGPGKVSPATAVKPIPISPAKSYSEDPEYLPSDKSLRESVDLLPANLDEERGALVGGVRVTSHGERSADITIPPLSSGTRLPNRLGGGYLYHNGTNLYFSTTLAGTLVPVFSAPSTTKIARLSLGPSYVLLHLDSGSRIAWSPKERRRIALPIPGLYDVAALDDGRAVTWLESNRLRVRGVGTYLSPIVIQGIDVQELRVVRSQIGLRIDDRFFSLELSGKLIDTGRPWNEVTAAKSAFDAGWSWKESPRELAMKEGVPIGDSLALVPTADVFATVDLRSGKVVHVSPIAVAGVAECKLLPMGADVLGICRTGSGGSVVIAHASSDAQSVERSFSDTGRFFAGDSGTLIKEGGCSGPGNPARYVICTRLPSGIWAELSMPRNIVNLGSVDAGVAPVDAQRHVRWVPTSNGGAVGIVNGVTPRLFDIQTQIVKSLPAADLQKHVGIWPSESELLSADFRVNRDGTIEGYALQSPLRLTSDGTLEPSPHVFKRISSRGALAVALDTRGRLWQSNDYGQQWSNVAPPPGQKNDVGPLNCSRAGCDFGTWFRIGYPLARTNDERLAIAPPAEIPIADSAPQLRCFSKGAISRRTVLIPADRDGNATRSALFGAGWVPARSGDPDELATFVSTLGNAALTRASYVVDRSLQSDAPVELAAALSRSTRLRYHEPFSAPLVRETSFTWNRVYSTVMQTLGQDASIDYSSGGSALPVLSRIPGKTEGVILSEGSLYLWIRANQPSRFGVFPPELGENNLLSAAVDAEGNLLFAVRNARTRIVKSEPTGIRVLADLPQIPPEHVPHPDALAMAANGTPAIIRMWSQEPPTLDDPALVMTDAGPQVLAPWSTLTSGNCEASDGYRAIVEAGASWLRLNLGGSLQPTQEPFLAMVQWNRQRVCLEAVEFPSETMAFGDATLTTSIVARFGANAFASRYAFDSGVEYAEPFECQLVPANRPPVVN